VSCKIDFEKWLKIRIIQLCDRKNCPKNSSERQSGLHIAKAASGSARAIKRIPAGAEI
tara:strand:+ start:1473 stop:1646 length:174 start_codon:yes stop_codon:yes gene_type:complete